MKNIVCRFLHLQDSSIHAQEWSVPDDLFAALADVLKHHEVEYLYIDNVRSCSGLSYEMRL